jgi:hypothetical protein
MLIYPTARIDEVKDTPAGVSFPGPNRWLEQESQEVLQWQRAQAQLASAHVREWPHFEQLRRLVEGRVLFDPMRENPERLPFLSWISPSPVAVAALETPALSWRPFVTSIQGTLAGHIVGYRYIAVTDVGAPRGRLEAIDLDARECDFFGFVEFILLDASGAPRFFCNTIYEYLIPEPQVTAFKKLRDEKAEAMYSTIFSKLKKLVERGD